MSMAKLAKAAIRLPWAFSVFGAQEFLDGVLKSPRKTPKKTLSDLYAVTEASQAQFEGNPYVFACYQIGDRVQRTVASAIHDTVALKVLDPDYFGKLGRGIFDTSLDAIVALATTEARRVTLQVAKNKMEVIQLVTDAGTKLGLPDQGEISLPEMIRKADSLGEYPAMWAMEGLGERYTRQAFRTSANPVALMTEGQGTGLADRTLPMMHAGMGIAFAKRLLARVSPWSTAAQMDQAVRWVLRLVEDNARPGYAGPVIGSLGLVTGSWHPQMLVPLSESLGRVDLDASDYFWHGVGRGSYFDPINMVPGVSVWKQSDTDPPNERARLHARAGVAWAFAAVNVRHPDVAASVMRYNRHDIGKNGGFSNGATSVMILGRETAPNDKYISAFCAFTTEPKSVDSIAAKTWKRSTGK